MENDTAATTNQPEQANAAATTNQPNNANAAAANGNVRVQRTITVNVTPALAIATLVATLGTVAIGFLALNISLTANNNATRVEMKNDIQKLETELGSDIQNLETEMKADNAELRAEMNALRVEINALRAEMQASDAALRAEMQENDAALRAEINALRAEIQAEIQALRQALDNRLDDIEIEQAGMRGELNVLRDANAPGGASGVR